MLLWILHQGALHVQSKASLQGFELNFQINRRRLAILQTLSVAHVKFRRVQVPMWLNQGLSMSTSVRTREMVVNCYFGSFTKEPCVFKAKPASKPVYGLHSPKQNFLEDLAAPRSLACSKQSQPPNLSMVSIPQSRTV